MKKIVLLILICVLLISVASCKANEENQLKDTDKINDESSVTTNGDSLDNKPETENKATEKEPEVTEEPEVEAPLGYTAPEGWYSPIFETQSVKGGDYELEYDVMGLKVYYVQKALGMNEWIKGYYRDSTIAKVSFFQSRNNIEATGKVNLKTWLALGLNENDWNNLGTYVTPVKIKRESDANYMRQVIVDTAKLYIDTETPYVVGAAGKPGEGVDCSGLVLQCMYASGIYPDGLNPVQHSVEEEYNSRLMWADPKLKEVDRGDIKPGDLVFYCRPATGIVCHVAVYIGDGDCIEALSQKVEILPVDKDGYGYAIKGFKTIFAE